MEQAISNEQGEIAVKWAIERRPAQPIHVDGTETTYVFTPKFNIWMIWVRPEHIMRVLAKREKSCKCNNGQWMDACVLASQIDVNIWLYGDRHGKPNES